ncbi:MAG: PilZ domain-containing protein [Planctomycetes bacterium]|nr:PilZ domain-containing protein [Planctomycetota bacterium]
MRCGNCGSDKVDADGFCLNCGWTNAIHKSLCQVCGESFLAEDLCACGDMKVCNSCRDRMNTKAISHSEGHKRDLYQATKNPRKAERVSLDQCFVVLMKKGTLTSLFGSSGKLSPVVDFSTTGLQCLTEMELELGAQVAIQFIVRGMNERFSLDGIVRRITPDRGARSRVGIEFDVGDFSTRQALEGLAKRASFEEANKLLGQQKEQKKDNF